MVMLTSALPGLQHQFTGAVEHMAAGAGNV